MNILLDGFIKSQSNLEQVTQSFDSTSATTSGGIGFLATVPGLIFYMIILVAIFYFFSIRPQKKREKELISLQDELRLGDWVLLDSGIYGKIAGISDNVFTIEFGTNKGVLIPVLKQRVVSKGEPNFSNNSEENK